MCQHCIRLAKWGTPYILGFAVVHAGWSVGTWFVLEWLV